MTRISRIAWALLGVLSALGASGPAGAVGIAVDGITCHLTDAIQAANADSPVGGCAAGSGADILTLGADVVLTSAVTAVVEGGASGLPAITSAMTIQAGAASTIERSSSLSCGAGEPTAFRLLEVSGAGDLTLAGLTLRNGCVAAVDPGAAGAGGAVLVSAGGALRVDGCTVEGNTALGGPEGPTPGGPGLGGGVAVRGGSLEIVDSIFSDNVVVGFDARGGAVAVDGGEVGAIAWSRFENNRASASDHMNFLLVPSSGGAIALRNSTAGSLAHLVITGNLAGRDSAVTRGGAASGGGIVVTGGELHELRDSLLSGNIARAGSGSPGLARGDGVGGGLANSGRIDSIARTTFSDNQAFGHSGGVGRGGGLDNTGQIGRIVAGNFLSNTAQGALGNLLSGGSSLGGGIANLHSIGEIAATTLVGNICTPVAFSAPIAGGGIYAAIGDNASDPGVRLVDSLLAGNSAPTGADCFSSSTLESLGFNLAQTPDASCDFSAPGDIVGEDPAALPPADNGCAIALPGGGCPPTVAFPQTSPAVDAGRCDAAGTELDARGAVRPFDVVAVPDAAGGDGCDIGAYERGASFATVNVGLSVADSRDPLTSGIGFGKLVYTVSLASLGSSAAGGISVAVTLPLPTGVTLDGVTPSVGSWDGSTWTVSSLASGGRATLTFVLSAGLETVGGPDALSLAAEVTAASGHSGELAADVERTTIREGLLFDGFESEDTSAWSLTVGGD